MDGLRLIRLLDVVPVTAAENAVGVVPRSLILTSPALEAVDQVLLNGVPSPAFAVYARNQLIAEVPEALWDAAITDIMVLSAIPTYSARSIIEFGIGPKVRRVSGIQRLIQTFVRLLLRTPGSNIFHPELGGGVRGVIGDNFTNHVTADIAIAISRVKRQIVTAQTPVSAIPAAERLLNAEIVSLVPDPANASMYCTIVLTAHDRQRSAATLVS